MSLDLLSNGMVVIFVWRFCKMNWLLVFEAMEMYQFFVSCELKS